ncbi:YihY/virulence factor BrkB family protein [Dehalobacter sp. DCM]|uniref:YihY/virulence factor BrkB family protein n=1 Tax=Dehalobacter sp. DCM TaxID=2907827 RepID=UPI003081454A|nr:YihY/virulence factor BrkB family protein [Dehalobacter sp. DCM]
MKWHFFFREYWKIVNRNELMALGGQVTYYMILSFFPTIIFLLTLISSLDMTNDHFFNSLKFLLPEGTYVMVKGIVDEIFGTRSTPALLSFGMLAALWASLNGINALIRGIVKAYGMEESRSFFHLKYTALVFLIVIVLAMIFSFIILVIGDALADAFMNLLGTTGVLMYLWQELRLIIQFLFLTATFVFLNRIATKRMYGLKRYFPGSLFASAGWVLLSLAFSYYVNHFNNYTLAYGSLAGIMLLLLWLYWICEILLLGCAMNAALIAAINGDAVRKKATPDTGNSGDTGNSRDRGGDKGTGDNGDGGTMGT